MLPEIEAELRGLLRDEVQGADTDLRFPASASYVSMHANNASVIAKYLEGEEVEAKIGAVRAGAGHCRWTFCIHFLALSRPRRGPQ